MKQIFQNRILVAFLFIIFFQVKNIAIGQNQTTRIEIESPSIFVEAFGNYLLPWATTTVGPYTGDRSSGTSNWRGKYMLFTPGTYTIKLGWYDNHPTNNLSEMWLLIGARTSFSNPPTIQNPVMKVDDHWYANFPAGPHSRTYTNVTIGATDTIFMFDYQSGAAHNAFWDYIEFNPTSGSGSGSGSNSSSGDQLWDKTGNVIFNKVLSTNVGIGTTTVAPGFKFAVDGKSFLNNSVGIATTCIPSDAKLAVNGKIYATEVLVKLTDANGCFPDYVFDSTYTLNSLDDVEHYIKENKHLPEVPSAKEVEQKGINIAEMDVILLKKIEELTLYVIEQRKLINQQEEVNEKLLKLLMEQEERIKSIEKNK